MVLNIKCCFYVIKVQNRVHKLVKYSPLYCFKLLIIKFIKRIENDLTKCLFFTVSYSIIIACSVAIFHIYHCRMLFSKSVLNLLL